MTRKPALDGIIFDFDGVIIESVQIKTDAFCTLLLPLGDEIANAAKRLHLDNLGMSRYAKFEIIYRDWLKQPLTQETMDSLDHKMSELIREGMLACPLVDGAEAALRELHGAIPMTVASGTPTPELREIGQAKGVSQYFEVMLGSPTPKPDLVQSILADFKWNPERVVMVGDATNDYAAAAAHGVGFVGRVPPGEANPFGSEVYDILPDLSGLVDRLQTKYP